jgi:hypothetical protein
MSKDGKYWRIPINDQDWADGWRRSLQEAVDAFLADPKIDLDQPVPIQIEVRKRSENPIHDYRVAP